MSIFDARKLTWHKVALFVLLCYPIMGSKWFPFGGGPRYLSVLAAPTCMLLLWYASRMQTIRPLLCEAFHWGVPFMPFAFVWMFAQFWHQYSPMDVTPITTLLWCSFLFMGSRLVNITHQQLAKFACIFSVAYGVIALVEVFIEGRGRAWGGVYENRFGQYAFWLSALCIIHFFLRDSQRTLDRICLLMASLMGLVAAWLSGSRGALSALPVLIVVLSLRSMNWRSTAFMFVSLSICVATLFYLNPMVYQRFILMYEEALQYFIEPTFTPTSIGVRLELARVAIVTWIEHPFLGVGYVSIEQIYKSYPTLGLPNPGILQVPGFHSDWFQVIGIGGGFLLLSLMVTCQCMFVRAKRDPYLLLFLGFSIVFSFSELFMTHNLGLGLLLSSWALYSAAECNRKDL